MPCAGWWKKLPVGASVEFYCWIKAAPRWNSRGDPSLPPGYNEAILKWPVNPDSGPCARAFFLKEQVIVADVASDLQWDVYGWRSLALSYGLRACWSTPILSSENAVLGTFALYSHG